LPLPLNPRPNHLTDAAIDARIDTICNAAGISANFGLFPAGATIRKVARVRPLREIGAIRALILEIANPVVSQGVADRSQFKTDPTGRMERTGDFLNAMIFGDRNAVKFFAKRYAAGHDSVVGVIAAGTCPDRTGDAYRGWDDDDREWVHASIFEAMIFAFDTVMLTPLTATERTQMWKDAVRIGEVIGLNPASLAADYPALRTWMDARLAATTMGTGAVSPLRPQLHLHKTVQDISDHLFDLVPAAWLISAPVAWNTVPLQLHPILPTPNPVTQFAQWIAYRDLQRLAAESVVPWIRWSPAYRAYRTRTGDYS
jgi:hypothetical protein